MKKLCALLFALSVIFACSDKAEEPQSQEAIKSPSQEKKTKKKDVGKAIKLPELPAIDPAAPKPFQDPQSKLWGYQDQEGNVVIKAQFNWAASFHGEIANVRLRNNNCLIDQKGEILIQDYSRIYRYGGFLSTQPAAEFSLLQF